MFSVVNRERPEARDLDLGEPLTYTITLTTLQNIDDVVLADIVPDSLLLDEKSVECVQGGCEEMESELKGIYLFMSNLNLQAGVPTVITYEANIKRTPKPAVMLKRLDFTTTLEVNNIQFQPTPDPYMDLLVSPPHNTSGQLMAHYTVAPRGYRLATTLPEENALIDEAMGGHNECIAALMQLAEDMGNVDPEDEDFEPPPEDFMDEVKEKCGMDKVEADLNDPSTDFMGNPLSTPEQCAADPDLCASTAMDDLADTIANISCIGGGCFPMPVNFAFLSPQSIVPMAMPLLSFPATMIIPPIGPVPFPSFFAMAPTPLGATTVPGTYMSMIRLYLIPTLTGGMGIAFCWLSYMGDAPVPPPLLPIPYPPPIGNCMTIALPMGAMPPCKALEQMFNKIMEAANSVVSDVNSGIAAVNGAGLPVELQTTDEQGGAGGLEISLAIDLGDSQKFDPPAKGASNKHVSSFDSIGGAIASWLDRQMLEMMNKLLTMPTIQVIIPNPTTLFMDDLEEFEKQLKVLDGVLSKENAPAEEDPKITQTKKDTAAGKKSDGSESALDVREAVEREIINFNTNVVDQLYRVADALPVIHINEHPIDFKIPWLSFASIKDFQNDLRETEIFYKKQWQKYVDLFEEYRDICPEWKNASAGDITECIVARVANIFVADLDTFIKSIQENIEVIQSYLTFPRDFILLKKQLADYMKAVACYLDSWTQMFGGWFMTIQNQLIGYAEVVFTIIEIVKQIEKLIDVFVSFEDSCDICTNERFANFGWFTLLGLVLPEIPIIKFPKWPDLVIDMTDVKIEINIELPLVHFVLEPIKLFKIPRIEFPDLPSINDLQLVASIPPLPVLPRLPELPKFPELPPLPMVDLPTLPPPPKLPDLGASLDVLVPLLEMILQVWCLIKKAFAPIPEAYLSDHMVLLTNRPAYQIPLDLLKPKFGDIVAFDTGFNEVRIETKVYLGLRLKAVLEEFVEISELWNGFQTDFSQIIEIEMTKLMKEIKQGLEDLGIMEFFEDVGEFWETYVAGLDEYLEEGWENSVQAKLDEWGKSMEDIDQLFRDAERDMQNASDKLTEIMGDAAHDMNQAWVNTIDRMNQELAKAGQDAAAAIRGSMVQWILDPFQGLQSFVDLMEEYDITWDGLQDQLDQLNDLIEEWEDQVVAEAAEDIAEAIDVEEAMGDIGEDLAEDIEEGTEALDVIEEGYEEHVEERLRDPVEAAEEAAEAIGETAEDIYEEIKDLVDGDDDQAYLPSHLDAQNALPGMLKQMLGERFAQMIEAIEYANENYVDYKVLKKKYNVPDFHFPKLPNPIDKVKTLRKELLAYSEHLEAEALEVENASDLFAYIQNQAEKPMPFRLASEAPSPENKTIFTSRVTNPKPSAPANIPQSSGFFDEAMAAGSSDPPPGSSGICAGSCLVDPQTGYTIQFIPYFDNPAVVQTAFIHSGIPGKSHVVYSDGSTLYLKRDLSVPMNITTNMPPPVSDRIFKLNDFHFLPLKGSINMMATQLTENGAASFGWLQPTHPDFYGVGIEMERSVLGYDADQQENNLVDVTIVLLPPNEDGSQPDVLMGDQIIEYGTLATSLSDQDEARQRFGIETKKMVTNGDKVKFPTIGNVTIHLNPNRAVYFDQYKGPSYRMNLDNGFYHIEMTWFDTTGWVANYNQNELLSPQIYVNAAPPMDIIQDKEFKFPIYKEGVIQSSDIFMDLADNYQYYWDMNQDGLPESVGPSLTIPRQKEPKEFEVDLVATMDLADENFERYTKRFKVVIYVPKIALEAGPLKEEGIVQGIMTPEEANHDLIDIPFSIFRKRWGTWKNLGLLRKRANDPTDPPISDKFDYPDNYYALDSEGNYQVGGFTKGPVNIIIRDAVPNDVAGIHPETGQIEIIDPEYELIALPASQFLPTRISVLKKGFDTVLANIYYIADGNTDIVILDEELNQTNVADIGVTIGDRNLNDTIIARNMPGYAESYPGGASIFDDATQKNIALLDTNGAIRMMQKGYFLRIKNEGALPERIMFEIVDSFGSPIFDVFIRADFNNLEIRWDEIWNEFKTTIGYLKQKIQPMFASLLRPSSGGQALLAQSKPRIPKPAAPESPFPDLDASHPFFQQILDLYSRRIVSGYGDGSFRPNAKLSRAEFVKIALGATNCFDCSKPSDTIKQKYGSTRPFPDVSLPAWYHYCIAIAKDLGMVTGYGDGFFRPGRNISRAEAAAVLLRQSEIEIEEMPEEYFLDVPEYAWYVDYVYTAVEIGLIQNQSGFVFPDEEITRGEFAFMASGILDLQDCKLVDTDEDGMPDWWEMENNLDPFFAGDAPSDFDEDGLTALNEFRLGTDPNDPNDPGYVPPEERCPCLDNPNQNDTDGDGIIDACDEDLDNDGVSNVLCIFDDNGLIDPQKAAESDDNCIFTGNSDQADEDEDDVGDICLQLDVCPEVPEDFDGYHDLDGCPEVLDDTANASIRIEQNTPGTYVNRGSACYFLDYEADLVEGDVIMTAITDVDTHEVIYTQSNEVTY